MHEHAIAQPTLTVRIVPPNAGAPKSILADGEIVFARDGGLLSGLKLVGFAICTDLEGEIVVRFPSRPGTNGKRPFVYLRAVDAQEPGAGGPLRRAIRQAYGEFVVAQQQSAGEADAQAEPEEAA